MAVSYYTDTTVWLWSYVCGLGGVNLAMAATVAVTRGDEGLVLDGALALIVHNISCRVTLAVCLSELTEKKMLAVLPVFLCRWTTQCLSSTRTPVGTSSMSQMQRPSTR